MMKPQMIQPSTEISVPRLPATGRIWFRPCAAQTRPPCSDCSQAGSTQPAAQAGATQCDESSAVPGTWAVAMVARTQSVSCKVSATSPVQSAASTAKASQMNFFIAVVLRFQKRVHDKADSISEKPE
ncbi:hypothetical protein G6F57_020873 [Rhizopus arrhizus]|nr:hypothetical protein G6F57_020873 [Rhizopus arrhizus]